MSSEIVLKFKDETVFLSFLDVPLHNKLSDLILWLRNGVLSDLPVITSAYRAKDPGVHGQIPLRGLDLRSKGYNAKQVVDMINDHWEYDSKRPEKQCAILHDIGKGEHIHLQVCDSTVIFKGKL